MSLNPFSFDHIIKSLCRNNQPMTKRFGVDITGVCRICGLVGPTEMHHIISQWRCDLIGKPELKKTPGNIVELCIECHSETTASLLARSDKIISSNDYQDFQAKCNELEKKGYIAVSEIVHTTESWPEFHVDVENPSDKGKVVEITQEEWTQRWSARNSRRARLFLNEEIDD